jgi:hypothetical protein
MQQNMSPELPLGSPAGRPGQDATVPAGVPQPEELRSLRVPDWAPPYDDEAGYAAPAASDLQAAPAASDLQTAGEDTAGSGSRLGRRDTSGSDRPNPPRSGGWPGQFAQALAETLAGTRPARQLTPWTTEQTRRRITELGPLLITGRQPKVRRIMTSVPRSGVIELTAVVGFGPRVRVLALRLERVDLARDRWRCTAIESA